MDNKAINICLRNDYQFKAGDRVCYKTHPNICIGYVSSSINFGNNVRLIDNGKEIKLIPIHTSDNWAKYFGHGSCLNSMDIEDNKIMLYTGN